MKKPTKKPQPVNYGPYIIEPPSGFGPFPMWHVRGPALDMSSTNEQSVRLRASEANACYQAGRKPIVDLIGECERLLADLREARDTGSCRRSRDSQIADMIAAIAKAEGGGK